VEAAEHEGRQPEPGGEGTHFETFSVQLPHQPGNSDEEPETPCCQRQDEEEDP